MPPYKNTVAHIVVAAAVYYYQWPVATMLITLDSCFTVCDVFIDAARRSPASEHILHGHLIYRYIYYCTLACMYCVGHVVTWGRIDPVLYSACVIWAMPATIRQVGAFIDPLMRKIELTLRFAVYFACCGAVAHVCNAVSLRAFNHDARISPIEAQHIVELAMSARPSAIGRVVAIAVAMHFYASFSGILAFAYTWKYPHSSQDEASISTIIRNRDWPRLSHPKTLCAFIGAILSKNDGAIRKMLRSYVGRINKSVARSGAIYMLIDILDGVATPRTIICGAFAVFLVLMRRSKTDVALKCLILIICALAGVAPIYTITLTEFTDYYVNAATIWCCRTLWARNKCIIIAATRYREYLAELVMYPACVIAIGTLGKTIFLPLFAAPLIGDRGRLCLYLWLSVNAMWSAFDVVHVVLLAGLAGILLISRDIDNLLCANISAHVIDEYRDVPRPQIEDTFVLM